MLLVLLVKILKGYCCKGILSYLFASLHELQAHPKPEHQSPTLKTPSSFNFPSKHKCEHRVLYSPPTGFLAYPLASFQIIDPRPFHTSFAFEILNFVCLCSSLIFCYKSKVIIECLAFICLLWWRLLTDLLFLKK